MTCAGREPGRAPDTVRVIRHVCDPLVRTAGGWLKALEQGRLLVRCEIPPNEGEGDCGFLSGEDHVERFDRECAALPVCPIDNAHGISYAIAVSKGEHGDHESTRQVDFVVERSLQRSVSSGDRLADYKSAGSMPDGVLEHIVEDVGRHDIMAAGRRIESVERCELDHAIRVVERGCDDSKAVVRRRRRGRMYQTPTPLPFGVGERGREKGDGHVTEAANRAACVAHGPRIFDRGYHVGDDVRVHGVLGDHGIEGRPSHTRIVVLEKHDEHGLVGGDRW